MRAYLLLLGGRVSPSPQLPITIIIMFMLYSSRSCLGCLVEYWNGRLVESKTTRVSIMIFMTLVVIMIGFVAACIKHILSLYSGSKVKPQSVAIVAHSMVCKTLTLQYFMSSIANIIVYMHMPNTIEQYRVYE